MAINETRGPSIASSFSRSPGGGFAASRASLGNDKFNGQDDSRRNEKYGEGGSPITSDLGAMTEEPFMMQLNSRVIFRRSPPSTTIQGDSMLPLLARASFVLIV